MSKPSIYEGLEKGDDGGKVPVESIRSKKAGGSLFIY